MFMIQDRDANRQSLIQFKPNNVLRRQTIIRPIENGTDSTVRIYVKGSP